ncbi:zinc-finger homeodomain protein 6-like [Impatiens glandulifera]|uniref:zinc-finger homeodomain protein 6-like n=1 Tax=Impatiens glandulifera TaxID=253017 RepID=UPI001FB1392B|nr:zinc-finger homeodomain protein 6-like [Impatiens glandulifera]
MEMTGEERGRATMAMRFKIPSPLVEATRRNDSTLILNPSSLDNLHLVKQVQAISERNPDTDQDSDPDPPPPPGFTAANTSVTPPQQSAASSGFTVMYKECLKNHAANMGGHVVDGCGEFMPGGGDDGSETALKCAACNCHRNFHRKEVEGEPTAGYNPYSSVRNGRIMNPQIPIAPPQAAAPTSGHHLYHQHHRHNYPMGHPIPPMMMAFGGGGGGGTAAESSSEDLNMLHSSGGGQFMSQPGSSSSKKRFRTKFTAEQKEKMHELAENLGWKIQKQSEDLVKKFCNEFGVKRQVFKVWMHNNKQAMKKKQQIP